MLFVVQFFFFNLLKSKFKKKKKTIKPTTHPITYLKTQNVPNNI